MPLVHSKSPGAFKTNVKTLMGEIGKSPHVQSREQALAVAYETKRRAGRAVGGALPKVSGSGPKISIPKPIAPFKPASTSPPFFERAEARSLGFSRPNLGALKAGGGGLAPAPMPWQARQAAEGLAHTGPILSAVPGRTDSHSMAVPSGSYVIPAETVSHLGQSNTLAGMKVLHNMFGPTGPYGAGAATTMRKGPGAPPPPRAMSDSGGARGKGTGAPVDVMTAGGEYVVPPDVVARIGGGNLDRGHETLDKLIMKWRQDHIRTLKTLKPPAKS